MTKIQPLSKIYCLFPFEVLLFLPCWSQETLVERPYTTGTPPANSSFPPKLAKLCRIREFVLDILPKRNSPSAYG